MDRIKLQADPNNPPLFNAITIETINRCTRKCSFCMYGTTRYKTEKEAGLRNKEQMSEESILKILDELQALDFKGRISFYRINEPLLDKRLEWMHREAKARMPECFLGVITNGDLLTQSRYLSLVDSGVDEIHVSVYGDREMEVISELLRWIRQESGAKDILLIKDRRRPETFVTSRKDIVDRGKPLLDLNCARPYTMLNVETNGDVNLCCCDNFGDAIMGNVLTSSIMEVWRGERFAEYRRRLMRGRRGIDLCQKCDYRGYGHKVRASDPDIDPPDTIIE